MRARVHTARALRWVGGAGRGGGRLRVRPDVAAALAHKVSLSLPSLGRSEAMPPVKGASSSEKGGDEDEDALPAYTEVVDNASLRPRGGIQ